jgi:hypothetical protein
MTGESTPRRGPKGGRKRFQLVIPEVMLEEARQLAERENRSISNMLTTLVGEALKARKENEKGPGRLYLMAA